MNNIHTGGQAVLDETFQSCACRDTEEYQEHDAKEVETWESEEKT